MCGCDELLSGSAVNGSDGIVLELLLSSLPLLALAVLLLLLVIVEPTATLLLLLLTLLSLLLLPEDDDAEVALSLAGVVLSSAAGVQLDDADDERW